MRGEFERVVQKRGHAEVVEAHENHIRDLERWLADMRLGHDQSGEERRVFAQRPGSWPQQDIADADGALEAGDAPEVIGTDFPAFGKAYVELDADEYAVTTSIAQERHFALNRLCGYSRDWDKTPTDT